MSVLESSLSVRSDAFRSNRDRMQRLIEETSGIAAEIMHGGPEHARTRHLDRGKLLPRDRVSRLLDPGSPFLEVGLFAAHDMYGGEVPSAGLITGHRPHRRHRVHGSVQRRDRERRHVLSTHGEEAAFARRRSRDRTGCRACTWSTRAEPTSRTRTRSSPTASTSGASSTTRRTSPPRASPRSRW